MVNPQNSNGGRFESRAEPCCKICSEPAPNNRAWFKLGRFTIPMCEVCGESAFNLARLVVHLRDELKSRGVVIGLPTKRR